MFLFRNKKKILFEKYLTEEEQTKLIKLKLISFISPILFTYGFLIINGSLIMYNSRLFFYIPVLFIIFFSLKNLIKNEISFLAIAREREKKEIK